MESGLVLHAGLQVTMLNYLYWGGGWNGMKGTGGGAFVKEHL